MADLIVMLNRASRAYALIETVNAHLGEPGYSRVELANLCVVASVLLDELAGLLTSSAVEDDADWAAAVDRALRD